MPLLTPCYGPVLHFPRCMLQMSVLIIYSGGGSSLALSRVQRIYEFTVGVMSAVHLIMKTPMSVLAWMCPPNRSECGVGSPHSAYRTAMVCCGCCYEYVERVCCL